MKLGVPIHLFNAYTMQGKYLNKRIALVLATFALAFGILGFIIVEGYGFTEALYMTVITISTVGYGEVRPLTPGGRIFATLLILINISEMDVRQRTGVNIIGLKTSHGEYVVNPDPSMMLHEGESFIFIGTENQTGNFWRTFSTQEHGKS